MVARITVWGSGSRMRICRSVPLPHCRHRVISIPVRRSIISCVVSGSSDSGAACSGRSSADGTTLARLRLGDGKSDVPPQDDHRTRGHAARRPSSGDGCCRAKFKPATNACRDEHPVLPSSRMRRYRKNERRYSPVGNGLGSHHVSSLRTATSRYGRSGSVLSQMRATSARAIASGRLACERTNRRPAAASGTSRPPSATRLRIRSSPWPGGSTKTPHWDTPAYLHFMQRGSGNALCYETYGYSNRNKIG